VLKAQHPEFEMWSQGIHARSGVSCADCHMPYVREGAIKVSNHHVRSPLLNVAQACQTCHRVPEKEITARALLVQDRNAALLTRGEKAVVGLIDAIARKPAQTRRPARPTPSSKAARAPAAQGPVAPRLRSWRAAPKTPWVSTPRRRPPASSPRPSTTPARATLDCCRRPAPDCAA
jgi:hypothetical protein